MASAMGLSDEDLSVMLQSGHPSQGHMPMLSSHSMLSSDAMGLLSGQLPFSPLQRTSCPGSMNMEMHSRGLERSSMSSTGSGGSSIMSQPSQWPFASDEKWELDRKNELLDSATRSFGGAPLQPLNQLSRTQVLQRYHSAPSSFLQCLSEFNEEAFSHVNDEAFAFANSPNPLGNSNETDDRLNFFNENLAPIMESGPSGWAKQPQSEKIIPRSNPMNSTEQYFAIQAENARQAALRESSMPSGNLKSLSRSNDFRSQTLKSNLLRQSSSPAELLAAINVRENDISPTDKKSNASMNSKPSMNVYNDAMMAGSGVFKMPTSPAANLAGKRVRFPGENPDDSDLLSADPSWKSGSNLLRHQSLPTSSTPLDPASVDMGYDDLLDMYSPCKTRARRGYATHPRSIAERNRRSRISERMKKLQDLVPNMDKQTNTADMLDEAVEYVKHLQLQVKDLAATIIQLKNGTWQPNSG